MANLESEISKNPDNNSRVDSPILFPAINEIKTCTANKLQPLVGFGTNPCRRWLHRLSMQFEAIQLPPLDARLHFRWAAHHLHSYLLQLADRFRCDIYSLSAW